MSDLSMYFDENHSPYTLDAAPMRWCSAHSRYTCKGRHNPRRCPDKPCNCTEYQEAA